MFELIDKIFNQFRVCFKRNDTFVWFVTIVFGIIVRSDFRGVTSILGALMIGPINYHNALHFFRSDAIDLSMLRKQWANIVVLMFCLKTQGDRIFIVGDHTKVVKEARYMPGIKKHHQESENSSKAEFIYGHDMGAIGVLSEGGLCVPIDIDLHGGSDNINLLENSNMPKTTSNFKLLQMVSRFVAETDKSTFVLLDAAFSTGEVFLEIEKINKKHSAHKTVLITRGKRNFVGYKKLEVESLKKKCKYGEKVELNLLFKTSIENFKTASLNIYGKNELVQYLCLDLFWKPACKTIRFVLVKTGDKTMILMCSDLNIVSEEIITAYTYRFKIEVSFKNIKHVIGGFSYHFWTKCMPKLSKTETNTDFSSVTKKEDINKISSTFRAIQLFALLSSIALGIIMLISETLPKVVWENYSGWLRTYSKSIPSVEVAREAIKTHYNRNYKKVRKYATLSLTQKHQNRQKAKSKNSKKSS